MSDSTPALPYASVDVPPAAARNAAFFLLLGLALVATFLAARRMAGALVEPLGAALPLLLAGIVLAAVSLAIRTAWHRGDGPPTWHDQLLRWGPTVCCTALALTLWLPGSPTWGVLLLAAVLVAEEAWSCRPAAWSPRTGANPPSHELRTPGLMDRFPDELDRLPEEHHLPEEHRAAVDDFVSTNAELGHEEPSATDEEVMQQLTRTFSSDGLDCLQGQVSTRLGAGQLRGSIHVAFCPPFEQMPEFDFEQIEGPEARVNLGQLLPYGARLDVKLSRPAPGPSKVSVELFASSPTANTPDSGQD